MPVQKAVELVGEGAGVEEALDRAGLILDGITSFAVERMDLGGPVYRVELKARTPAGGAQVVGSASQPSRSAQAARRRSLVQSEAPVVSRVEASNCAST